MRPVTVTIVTSGPVADPDLEVRWGPALNILFFPLCSFGVLWCFGGISPKIKVGGGGGGEEGGFPGSATGNCSKCWSSIAVG